MATLDDKLLGEKKQYYYSSSEDEGQASDDEQDKKESREDEASVREPVFIPNDELGSRTATKTGPKGVIADWRRYKQLESEKREQQEAERKALHKKLALTCQSHLDEENSKKEEEAELGIVLDEEFLRKYREERLREMRIASQQSPTFGEVLSLEGEEYVDAIDNENALVTVMVHIYLENIPACVAMNGCFNCLAKEYPKVKFCTVRADKVQVSKSFSTSALPALLVYRGGNVIGNFVRVSDELGEDFYSIDVEAFLQQHSLLPSKEEQAMLNSSIRTSAKDDEDSDLELD